MKILKIPFLYIFEESKIESMADIDERKVFIKDKIKECQDVIKDQFVFMVICFIFGVIPFLVISFLALILQILIDDMLHFLEIVGKACAFFALLVCLLFIEYNRSLEKRYKRLLKKLTDSEKEKIKEKVDEDIFENSIKLSYKYLDEYYDQTRKQAQKGFYVTVFVAVFGAALISFGIIIMYKGNTKPAYVTCAAGVITEFISSVFFYLYNKTITSMSAYHNKLVLSQNISIALKVADSLPEKDRLKSKNIIIKELLKDINSYFIIPENSEKDKE